jgi:hypothetical protein
MTKQGKSSATTFGSAIHKAIETWYGFPYQQRTVVCNDFITSSPHVDGCPVCSAIKAFSTYCPTINTEDFGSKRSLLNGVEILKGFFTTYRNDEWDVMSKDGKPMVELDFSFNLFDSPKLSIDYFGTIDCIMQNRETGLITVCDHKTTSSLGVDFYNRIKPNHQYTGYVMGARNSLHLDTNTMMINGLQVAKTKKDYARQITSRDAEDFDLLTSTVKWVVAEWLTSIYASFYPMSTPTACSNYSGCGYRYICEASPKNQDTLIETYF